MADTQFIQTAFERRAKTVWLCPELGRTTAKTTVRLQDRLACDVTDGPWRLTTDYPEDAGGRGGGPTPDVLLRAALGSALAASIRRWAATLGVPIQALEVEVHAERNLRRSYGFGKALTDTALRTVIRIESTAPEAEVRRVIGVADAATEILDLVRHAVQVEHEVHITPPNGETRATRPEQRNVPSRDDTLSDS